MNFRFPPPTETLEGIPTQAGTPIILMKEKYNNIAVLSLGSNVGDRLKNLQSAVDLLFQHKNIFFVACSSIYETEPVLEQEENPQDNYFNTILLANTSLTPHVLLELAHRVETALGRKTLRKKNEPRTIDIDIIFFGDRILASENLTIPHPKAKDRHFVLVPLCEVAPNSVDPSENLSATALLKRLDARLNRAYMVKRFGPIAPRR